jgi:hypothetical protein
MNIDDGAHWATPLALSRAAFNVMMALTTRVFTPQPRF